MCFNVCPFIQGAVLEDLQKHIRLLEQEKVQTQHEVRQLREKIEEMKTQLSHRPGDEETVSVNYSKATFIGGRRWLDKGESRKVHVKLLFGKF